MIVNGTTYDDRTPLQVIRALEKAREGRYRIRLYYGDQGTGKDWDERYDVAGYVSRSMGPVKVPILLAQRHSHGGGAILDRCIVRIRYSNKRDGGDIYRHPNYHLEGRSRANDLPAEPLEAN